VASDILHRCTGGIEFKYGILRIISNVLDWITSDGFSIAIVGFISKYFKEWLTTPQTHNNLIYLFVVLIYFVITTIDDLIFNKHDQGSV